MFIKHRPTKRGFTLIEIMVATAIFSIVAGAVGTAYMFSLRSFQGLSNYAQLDKQNRVAMDTITREIRQANCVVDYKNGDNSYLTLKDGAGGIVTYAFNKDAHTMNRYSNGVAQVLLKNCSLIKFNLGMRPGLTNSWCYYPTTNVNLAKVVDLTWKTGIGVRAGLTNSENIQTAQIVIRKQQLSQ